MRPIYIVVGVISLIVLIIVIIICIKSKVRTTDPTVSASSVLILLNKRKQAQIEKYMPSKQFREIITEYHDLANCSECMICLGKFNEEEKCRLTICYHLFHDKCIDEWLTKNETCPFCRASLNINDIKQTIQYYQKQDEEVEIHRVGQIEENGIAYNHPNQINIPSILENEYIKRIRINSMLHKKSPQSNQPNILIYNQSYESPITIIRSDNQSFLHSMTQQINSKTPSNDRIQANELENQQKQFILEEGLITSKNRSSPEQTLEQQLQLKYTPKQLQTIIEFPQQKENNNQIVNKNLFQDLQKNEESNEVNSEIQIQKNQFQDN